MASTSILTFTGTRVAITAPLPFDIVLNRLNQEIQSHGSVTTETLQSSVSGGKEDFIKFFSQNTGPSGFIQFHEIDHTGWVQLFSVGNGLRLKRILLGNPLIAITMLRHDLSAGLFVPVELLLRELGEKSTEVTYVLPSSLISGTSHDENLKEAAQQLDLKFKTLAEQITA